MIRICDCGRVFYADRLKSCSDTCRALRHLSQMGADAERMRRERRAKRRAEVRAAEAERTGSAAEPPSAG